MSHIYKALQVHKYDLLSHMFFYDKEELIAGNRLSVSYNPRNSSSHAISLSLSYDGRLRRDTRYREENSEETDSMTRPLWDDSTREVLRRVNNGIEAPNAKILVAAVSIGEKPENAFYTINLAHADSPVSDLSRWVLHYVGKPLEKSRNIKNSQ